MSHWKNLNAIVLILSVVLTALASVSMNHVVTWDLKNYHLYSGYSLLNKPMNYDFAPAQVQTYFNPLLHVPTYLVFETLPSGLALALLGAVQGLNLFLLFVISQLLFLPLKEPLRTLLSLCCAFAGFYGAANLGEIGTTLADNLVSIPILSGLYLLLRHLLRDQTAGPAPRLPLVLAGILIGAAFGLKLSHGPFAFAAFTGFMIFTALRKEGIRPILVFSAGMVVAFLCVYGFWGTSLYLQYGNPFYPYFNEVFGSPYYALHNTNDPRFLPRDWRQALFYPFYFAHRNNLVCEMQFRDARFAFCYVAVLLLALFSLCHPVLRRKDRKQNPGIVQIPCLLFLVTFSILSYIAWQLSFSIYRYLIPLELLAPVQLAAILLFIIRKPLYAFLSSLLLNILIVNSVVPPEFGQRDVDYDSLKFTPPAIGSLEDSVILMGGYEPTSYMGLRFPRSTRLVRIQSDFMNPGQNRRIDAKIRETVAEYGIARIRTYFASASEIDSVQKAFSFYRLKANLESCVELRSSSQSHGLLCQTFEKRETPPFNPSASVRLLVTPKVVTAGKDRIVYQVIGMKTAVVDVFYTLNGEQKPSSRGWRLDNDGRVSFLVGPESVKGIYHIVGIRDALTKGDWIKVDAVVEIE